jgi:hypothetical protein
VKGSLNFETVLDFLVIKAIEDIEHPCKNINIVRGNSNSNLGYIHSNKKDETISISLLVSGKCRFLQDLSPPSNELIYKNIN